MVEIKILCMPILCVSAVAEKEQLEVILLAEIYQKAPQIS